MTRRFAIALALAIWALTASCSLVFENTAQDGGSQGDQDASGEEDDAGADQDAGEASPAGSSVFININDDGGHFPDWASYQAARAGDLTRRQFLRVTASGEFAAGEAVSAGDSQCTGTLRPRKLLAPVEDHMTIDLEPGSPACSAGDLVTNANGAEALVEDAGSVGVRETVNFVNTNVPAPLIIDGFSADNEHYLIVRASPGQPHKGVPNTSIVVSSEDFQPHHGVVVRVPFTKVEGLEVTEWAAGAGPGANVQAVRVEANGVVLDRLLIHNDGAIAGDANSDGIVLAADHAELEVRNSFLHTIGRSAVLVNSRTASRINLLSSTIADCMGRDATVSEFGCVSIRGSINSEITVINTIVVTTDDVPTFLVFDGSGTATSSFGTTSSNNASNDGTAPGANSQIANTTDLIGRGQGFFDMHLADSDGPLATGGIVQAHFDDDIDGDSRPSAGAWSIGADHPSP